MIRHMAFLLLTATASAASAQEATYRDPDFRVTDIQARFVYEQSGSLSVDLTDNPALTLWNSIIGEGDAAENADDVLVTALVQGPGQHNLTLPLRIVVRAANGKVLASRTVTEMLAETKTYRGLMLFDVGCAGVVSITAQLGTSVRSEEIALPCGE